jgi:hypothetical protein
VACGIVIQRGLSRRFRWVTAILVGFDIDANSGVATGVLIGSQPRVPKNTSPPTTTPSNLTSNCASRF